MFNVLLPVLDLILFKSCIGKAYLRHMCLLSVAFCSLKHKLSSRCAIVVVGVVVGWVLCAKFFNVRLNFHNMLITAISAMACSSLIVRV